MPRLPWPLFGKLACLYLIASLGGYLASRIGIPLPWMIGPLLVTAALSLGGVLKMTVPAATRPPAQALVAAQVGLYFTPAAMASVVSFAPMLFGMALVTLALACLIGAALAWSAKISLANAVVATLPTSPVEAAVIAEQYGFATTPVVLAQTLRTSSVVVIVPLTIYALKDVAARPVTEAVWRLHLPSALMMVMLMLAGVWLFKRLKISNPNFLGPLTFLCLASVLDLGLRPLPNWVTDGAQLVMGCWLGAMLRREVFRRAGRLMSALILTTFSYIFIAMLCGYGLARALGMDWELMVLGTAPGGVTEMALTSKYLGSGVALVTAFHIIRLFTIMPNVPRIIAFLHWLEQRSNRPAA